MNNPITTLPDEAKRKQREQAAISTALGAKEPGSPVAAPGSIDTGKPESPEALVINGVRHMNLPDQKFPGPLSMMASAAAGTIGHIASAPFSSDSRLEANRAGLDTSAEVSAEQKRQEAAKPKPTAGTPMGTQAAANQGIADLQGRQAGYMIDNNLSQFEDKGNGIARQVGADGKTMFTNVGTADVTDATKKVQVNGYDGAADNASLAKANAIRQEMIDRQPQGGIAVLPDQNADWNARMDRQSMISGMRDEMRKAGTRTERAAIGQALNTMISGENQLATESLRGQNQQVSEQGRNTVAMRGQDMLAQNEANRLAGNPVDNQLKTAQMQGITAATDSTRQQSDLRNKLLTETDPAKRMAIQESLLVAQGRDPSQGRYVRLGGGEQVIDPVTGQKAKQPDTVFDSRTVQTVQSGKRGLTDENFAAIGKAIGLPADALKSRYADFQKQGPITRLDQLNAVDVALALADGTPPEKIASKIKSLGGNPAEFGL